MVCLLIRKDGECFAPVLPATKREFLFSIHSFFTESSIVLAGPALFDLFFRMTVCRKQFWLRPLSISRQPTNSENAFASSLEEERLTREIGLNASIFVKTIVIYDL